MSSFIGKVDRVNLEGFFLWLVEDGARLASYTGDGVNEFILAEGHIKVEKSG